MKRSLSLEFLIIIFTLMSAGIYAQGNSQCGNALPFCTGNTMNFPAATNAGPAQPGPNYGCLGSEPNPAWFFMQMQSSGFVSIAMSANNDIDFICWGPFPNLNGACSNLTQGNTQSCSYSASNTETCTIANAVAGQFYILLITNFSNQQQSITFNQTNGNQPGAGVTNCGIICTVTPISTGPICPGGSATISATTGTSVNTYTWIGPGGFNASNTLTNVINNIQTTSVFTLQGTTSTGSCQAMTTVTVIPYPVFSLVPPTATVCQGGSFIASMVNSNPQGNPASYSYQWSGPPGMAFSSPNAPASLVSPGTIFTPTAIMVYTAVITPTVLNCPFTATLSVRVDNPATPTLTPPAPLCNIFTQTVITANPGGGTFWGNPLVQSNGIILPNTAQAYGTFSVGYTYTLGSCTATNAANISISLFNTSSLTVGTLGNKCVHDPPFNLNTVAINQQGIWSGANVSANTFSPAGLPSNTYMLTYFNPSTPYGNICPSTTTVNVIIFNPPTPVITPILPRCTNSAPVSLIATPAGGVWSGNSGVNTLGIQTPSLSANVPGVNSVDYTAGQGTCVASSSATFHVSRFNSAALNVSFLNICVTTNTINLMSLVTSTVNGAWTGGLGLIGTYSFAAATLSTGIYNVTYNTISTPPSSIGTATCDDFRVLPISVLNPVMPTISTIGPICNADAPIQLQVSPNTGSFVPNIYLTPTGLFTPSLSAVGSNTIQYVVGTSTCNVRDTKIINVEAFVPSTIISSLPDQCNTNGVVDLRPITANTLGIWSGAGVLGTSFNPSASGVGAIALTYQTASSPSGLCPSQSSLAVNVYSLASPAISLAGPYCNSNPPFRLSVSPLGGLFGSSGNTAVDAQGWFNPAFAIIGNNVVNYSVSSGPCVAYAQTIIQIERFVSADFFKYAGPFCKNESPFDLNSIAQNPYGAWAGPGVSGSLFTPANANIGNTNLIFYRTHSITDDLCPDTSTMRILVNDIPQVSIVRDVTKGCIPVIVTFNTPNINFGKGQWKLGDGSEPVDGLTATHSYTAPGTYSVVLNYWDEIGCSTQTVMTNAVTAFDVPQAGFTYEPYDEITIAHPDVQFINRTKNIGTNSYLWQIADMYSTSEVNPTGMFTKAGDYRITLTATNLDGCKDEVSQILVVKPDFSVFIPNTFTPNADEINDYFLPVFSPYGLDTRTFEMEIFDRWGVSLYHTKDYTKGWDGTINNKGTEPLKQEVYIYKVKFKDLEGRVYNKLGHVTLLK